MRTHTPWALGLLALLAACSGGDAGRSLSTSSPVTGGGSTPPAGVTGLTASFQTPADPLGPIAALDYDLIDPQGAPTDVEVLVSSDDGQTWQPATPALGSQGHEGTTGLTTSALGARHRFVWDALADLGSINTLHVRVRITPERGGQSGLHAETGSFPVIIAGRQDPDCAYDPIAGELVLSADLSGGFVPYTYYVNHVVHTKIYGDGKVVFIDAQTGFQEIHQGQLSEPWICALLKHAAEQGIWQWQASYRAQMAPTDLPSGRITCKVLGRAEQAVSSYGLALSAPPGYMELYDALHVPALRPTQVQSYIRQTITSYELQTGQYPGEEFEKKLDTPIGWVWVDQGPGSSYWHEP